MKHILNNLSEEEKNAIREQHTGGMKVMTENFNKLLNSKLGDAKPLNEETNDSMPNSKIISTLNQLGFEKKFCNKSSRGKYGDDEKDSNYCNRENPDADILITYKSPYDSVVIVDMESLNKEVIDNVTPSEIEITLKRMFPLETGLFLTEGQYSLLLEQQLPFTITPEMEKIILNNKKYFGEELNTVITPEYIKKVNNFLSKKNVNPSKRTLMGSLVGLIPVYEQYLDFNSIIDGITTGNKATLNTGIIGMTQSFGGSVMMSLFDYFSEKVLIGKEATDKNVSKREGIVNMSDNERQKLFKKYGYGGYDKWIKDGKPKL